MKKLILLLVLPLLVGPLSQCKTTPQNNKAASTPSEPAGPSERKEDNPLGFLLAEEDNRYWTIPTAIGVSSGLLAVGLMATVPFLKDKKPVSSFKEGDLEIFHESLVRQTTFQQKTTIWQTAAIAIDNPELTEKINQKTAEYLSAAAEFEKVAKLDRKGGDLYDQALKNLKIIEDEVIGTVDKDGKRLTQGLIDITDHKINVALLKIEFGGGHKSAAEAIEKALMKDGGLGMDRRYIEIKKFDFFAPTGDGGKLAAKTFNDQLQREARQGLKELVGEKKSLERYYRDNPEGQKQIRVLFEGGEDQKGKRIQGINEGFANGNKPTVLISPQPFGLAGIERYLDAVDDQDGRPIMRVMPTDQGMADWFQYVKSTSQIRYDGSWNHPFVKEQFEKAKIKNYYFGGFPVREEIVQFANRLHRQSPEERAKALKEAEDFLVAASKEHGSKIDTSREPVQLFDKKGELIKDKTKLFTLNPIEFDPKKDKSLFMMMGSQGISSDRYLAYMESILKDPPDIVGPDGKIHVYAAAITTNDFPELLNEKDVIEKRVPRQERPRRELLAEGLDDLIKKYGQNKVVFHMMPFVEGDEVAKFLATSPIITKAGGATSAEIATIGEKPGILNMRVTEIAPWEYANSQVLKKNGLAIPLPFDESNSEVEFKAIKSSIESADKLTPTPLDSRGFGSDFFDNYQRIVFSDLLGSYKGFQKGFKKTRRLAPPKPEAKPKAIDIDAKTRFLNLKFKGL